MSTHANQLGGSIKVVLSSNGSELASTQSGLFINPLSYDANLTLSTTALVAAAQPYTLALNVYWVDMSGSSSLEATRQLKVNVVKVWFTEESYSPYEALSATPFNLTVILRNIGNDVAYAAAVDLTDSKWFVLQSDERVEL
jgi:hypothetical protein